MNSEINSVDSNQLSFNITKTLSILSKELSISAISSIISILAQINKDSIDHFSNNIKFMVCAKCQNILFEPKTCSACKQTFCSDCIEAQNNGDCCLNTLCLEGKGKYEDVIDEDLRDKLSQVTLRCKNDCDSTDINLLNLKKHLKICKSKPNINYSDNTERKVIRGRLNFNDLVQSNKSEDEKDNKENLKLAATLLD